MSNKNESGFALRGTASAVAVLGLVLAHVAAVAQETKDAKAAEPALLETVTITGARKSAESAQAIKRNSDQVVDSIVADDIGKFPDKNVAEILGRITGVQTIRESGEAGQVIVRGLGGITTLLNGREIFTAAGRNLYLSDIPATMLKQIDVYKTQGADISEGGTAGVIDVRTNRPFDLKGQVLSLAGRAEYRDKAKSTNPDLSGMYSNRWQTPIGEIGALLGLSYQKGTYQDETAWVSPPIAIERKNHTVDGVTGGTGTVTGFDAAGRVLNTGVRKRDTTNFAMQWRPNADLEVYAEGFRTVVNHDSESDFMVGALPWWGAGATITTIPGTNNVGTFSHPSTDSFTLASTQARRDFSRGEQYALGAIWDVTPQLRATTELAHTNSNYKQANPIMDLRWTTPKAVSAAVVNGGGYLTYPGNDITNGKNWNIAAFFDNRQHAESNSTDWRGDLTFDIGNGFFKEVSAGLRLNERQAQHINNVDGYTGTPAALAVSSATVPGLGCLSGATGGDYGFKQFWTPCRSYLLDQTDAARLVATGSAKAKAEDPLSFFKDVEKTQAIYLKSKMGINLGGVPITATAGVRVVRTEQAISGYNQVGGVTSNDPFTTTTTSIDTLPSVSLKAILAPGVIARLVAGKAIQRPNFGDFNPGLRLYPTNGNTTLSVGNAGNPALKPIESKNVDATLEWYFAPTGSVTATLFRHNFSNFLVWKGLPETYDGITYTVTRPYNAQQGHLEGAELGYRQFYDKLPGAFSGLGLEANFTYMKGGLKDVISGNSTDFPGMSKTAFNLVGLYEKYDWYGRLAFNWRSKFTAEYNYRNTGLDLKVDALRWLDASIGYNVNKQMTLSLDANNLLDQDYHDYHSTPAQPRDVRRYDRTVGLSVRWKL